MLSRTCFVLALALLWGSQLLGAPFIRGDVDASGRIDITDPVLILRNLFLGQELSCLDAADVDDNGTLEITDGIFLLDFLFRGGHRPPDPFGLSPGHCGLDRTRDQLDCHKFEACFCEGFIGFPCDPGEFCDLTPGDCLVTDAIGTCVRIEDPCPEFARPVCGCDGVTYDNDCFRILARVQKDHDGPCR